MVDEIEVNEDTELQKRNFRLQKYLKIGLAVFLALSLLGIFGGGLLSRAQAETQDGNLTVSYDRFLRLGEEGQTVTEIKSENPEISISFSDDIYENFNIEEIYPRPDVESKRDDKVFYLFRLTGNNKSVIFRIRPKRSGVFRVPVGTFDGQEVNIRQYIYP